MNLSIFILVLTGITYECQCAPAPDWVEDLQLDMQKLTQQMNKNQQQMDKTFKAIGQQTQNIQKHFEDQMKHIGQLSNDGINGLQDPSGIKINTVSGHSKITTSRVVNGNRVDKTTVEHVIDNVKYKTETEYISATGKTVIKEYECSFSLTWQCVLKNTEIKVDGSPENFTEYL